MKRIVVVDSGLNDYTGLNKESIVRCINVLWTDETVQFIDVAMEKIPDDMYHGTSVMSILQRYCINDRFIVIKAFNDEFEIPSFIITRTLQYICDYIDCDIINLCCGCIAPQDTKAMEAVCETLKNKGIVIVAAFSNEGVISYPAGFECVIGVDYSLSCFLPQDYYYIENSSINIRGIGHPQNLPVIDNVRRQQVGASFVAPHITGLLMRQKEKIDYFYAKELLKENAKDLIQFLPNKKNNMQFKIHCAAIFRYSKEMDVLLRFSKMLDFKIDTVLCTKYQFPSTLNRLLDSYSDNKTICLECIDRYPWNNSLIDTIIIGHVNLLSKALKCNLKSLLLEKAITYGKNVYMFDDVENDEKLISTLISNGHEVFIPKIEKYKNNNYGKLYSISTPVISIFGTGPKQGKFSLQLNLRKYLTSCGYKVANFGTEPTATLFGFESCYPYGYNSTVHIEGEDAISYINSEIARLDKENPDIIMIGTQSQTIPTSEGNIGFYNYKQYEIILATQPDAHFLCVYINDETDFIIRTIHFLEAINDSCVIGIVVFPYLYTNDNGILSDERRLQTDDAMELIINRLKESTHKPVFSFFDSLLTQKLLEIIQNVFS